MFNNCPGTVPERIRLRDPQVRPAGRHADRDRVPQPADGRPAVRHLRARRACRTTTPASTEGYFIGTDARCPQPPADPARQRPGRHADRYRAHAQRPHHGVPDRPGAADGSHHSTPSTTAHSRRELHRNKITGALTLWTAHAIQVNASRRGLVRRRPQRRRAGTRSATSPPRPRWSSRARCSTPPPRNPFGYIIPSVMAVGPGPHGAGRHPGQRQRGNGGFASVVAAGRLRTDAVGATQAPTLVQGEHLRLRPGRRSTPERWGDYSHTALDPNDDQTLWTFQEYASATNTWSVRAVQLRAPPPATPATATPATVVQNRPSVNVVDHRDLDGRLRVLRPRRRRGRPRLRRTASRRP